MKLKILIITAVVGVTALSVRALKKDAYSGSRIFWDTTTQKTIFTSGGYSRMIQLQDGRLMAVAESGGVSVSYSSNMGSSWSSPAKIVGNPSLINNAVPDLIQLADGTIIVGYNPRPHEPYTEDRRFGIRAVRSTDNGQTWSDPIFIFDSNCDFSNGCWEPSFLELPSGELQVYFADETPYTTNNDQQISMCRSFDKGLTWSTPVKVSYRQGSRDGMPVPILLKDKSEIVVIIEDNGWPGTGHFRATTVRSTLEDNWNSGYVAAGSPMRNQIFAELPSSGYGSGAPYLRMLPSGETVASYQGNEGRGSSDMNNMVMFVEMGDDRAKNFKARSNPFIVPEGSRGLWNSVAVIDTGVVVALSSIGAANTGTHVEMIKGYPRKHFVANYGTPEIDGSATGEDWTFAKASQVLMGQKSNSRMTADYLYDDKNLYFTMRVIDRNIFTDKVDNDGVSLYLDLNNACDIYPQAGMYQFFFDVNGSVIMKYGAAVGTSGGGKWNACDDATVATIDYKVNVKSIYYEMEVAIPWAALGLENAPVGSEMRTDISVRNRQDASIEYETIVDTDTQVNKPNSWAWMGFRLNPNGSGGVTEVANDYSSALKVAKIANGVVAVSAESDIDEASLYSFDGRLIRRVESCGNYCEIMADDIAVGVLHVTLANGNIVSRKIML